MSERDDSRGDGAAAEAAGQEPQVVPLRREALAADPFEQFRSWYEEALAAALVEPTAASLATVDEDGRPSVRVVLLKGYDARGFVFYTNYQSRKAVELDATGSAALTFWWDRLARQIRIEGSCERVSEEESDRYFTSRPRGSQIGAWASAQSQELASRSVLETAIEAATGRFAGGPVPRPPHWGGFRLTPASIEFWQGQPNRLHDRFIYRRREGEHDRIWSLDRLSP